LITDGIREQERPSPYSFAQEGADIAINYFPEEQSDAEEVRKAGGKERYFDSSRHTRGIIESEG
jgi:hypothetical protein